MVSHEDDGGINVQAEISGPIGKTSWLYKDVQLRWWDADLPLGKIPLPHVGDISEALSLHL